MIAQEVRNYAPYMIDTTTIVTDTANNQTVDILSYNAHALKYIIINAIKELDCKFDSVTIANDSLLLVVSSFESRITDIETALPACCDSSYFKSNNRLSNNEEEGNYRNAIINSKKNAVLHQTQPNPFDQNTTIRYFIPKEATTASVIIYDLQGRQIKQFSSLERGEGSVTVNGGELYPGIFIYAMIVDGEEITTKRMILTK
ncbi:MAG: T9SS type A sorting domain-containing protein [Bacteroidota bacterium]